MSRRKIERIEGIMMPGRAGICGDAGKCALANELREVHGVKNPKVGFKTISWRKGDLKYSVETPVDVVTFLRQFDRNHQDGETEIVKVAVPYSIPMGGKSVTITPVKKMTEAVKATLHTYSATPRGIEATAKSHARVRAQRQARSS